MNASPRYAVLISYPVYNDRDAISAIHYYPLMHYGTPEGAWAGMMLWEIKYGGGDREAHARDTLTGEAILNPRKASLTIGSFINPEIGDEIPF